MVQCCVRRWLARARYKRVRWQMASSVVTLQRYVRGWIARKGVETMKNKEQNRKNKAKDKAARRAAEAIIPKDKKSSPQRNDDSPNSQSSDFKENWGNVKMRRKFFSELEVKDEAATIIQSRKLYAAYFVHLVLFFTCQYMFSKIILK